MSTTPAPGPAQTHRGHATALDVRPLLLLVHNASPSCTVGGMSTAGTGCVNVRPAGVLRLYPSARGAGIVKCNEKPLEARVTERGGATVRSRRAALPVTREKRGEPSGARRAAGCRTPPACRRAIGRERRARHAGDDVLSQAVQLPERVGERQRRYRRLRAGRCRRGRCGRRRWGGRQRDDDRR